MPADIIIVHYKDLESLELCIHALELQTCLPASIIIVDNSDDLPHDLQSTLNIELIRPKANLGFAVACNLATRHAQSEHIVFLNADAFPRQDWLEQLFVYLERYPERVCLSSKQVFYEAPHLLDGTGDSYHPSGLYWRRGYKKPLQPYPEEVFSASGAAMLVKRDVFLELGGFDETFFAYGEDVDFGFRLRLVGHASYYCEDAVVEHVGYSSSGGRHSSFSLYYGHRNLVWVFFKNMPFPFLLLFLPLHLMLNVVTLIKFGLQGQAKTLAKAKWHAFKGLAAILSSRSKLRRSSKVSLKALWQAFSLRK